MRRKINGHIHTINVVLQQQKRNGLLRVFSSTYFDLVFDFVNDTVAEFYFNITTNLKIIMIIF
jgi:hypothetical protein